MVSFLIWQVYGDYICHRSSKQLNKSCNIQLVLFLCFRPKNMHFRLSVRCLLGVWWVSGGCLVGVWWVSGTFRIMSWVY